MSRGYRITWVSAARVVNASDKLTIELSLLGILPEDEMKALLRDELKREGWKEGEEGSLTAKEGEVDLKLEPDGKTVTAEVETKRRLETRALDKDSAQRNLDAAEKKAKKDLESQAVSRLAKVEPDLRARLGEAVQRVYVEALKRKAASMGQVESISQERRENGEHEVTIKIKV